MIDLYDGQQHTEELKSINGYSNVRKLSGKMFRWYGYGEIPWLGQATLVSKKSQSLK